MLVSFASLIATILFSFSTAFASGTSQIASSIPLILTVLGAIGTALLAIGNNWFQWFNSQTIEKTRLRASLIQKALEQPTPQARKDYLLFLLEAGLITDPDGKIKNLNPDKIPHQFGFVASASLTPELASALDRRLQEFQDYIRSIGLQADTKPKVHIRSHDEMLAAGAYCYYDREAADGPLLVVDALYADDADLLLREYCHHVLAVNGPAGLPGYQGDWKSYWPHFSIESALAYYLPCSFGNNPRFAESAMRKDLPEIDMSKSHRLAELKADKLAMYTNNAEVWGSFFWELRARLGGPRIDGLLARAYFTLNENTTARAQTKAFGKALEHIATQELDASALAQIRKVFAAQGLD